MHSRGVHGIKEGAAQANLYLVHAIAFVVGIIG